MCDRFCAPDFTTLRGRGTSRAVNTFCVTADFFRLSKIKVINPRVREIYDDENETRRKTDAYYGKYARYL